MDEMVSVEVGDLKGGALDWAVAQATENEDVEINSGYSTDRNGAKIESGLVERFTDYSDRPFNWAEPYSPSTDWSQGGPLIQLYKLAVWPTFNGTFCAGGCDGDYWGELSLKGEDIEEGSTPLVAICRSVVCAQLGGVVEVPAILMPS